MDSTCFWTPSRAVLSSCHWGMITRQAKTTAAATTASLNFQSKCHSIRAGVAFEFIPLKRSCVRLSPHTPWNPTRVVLAWKLEHGAHSSATRLSPQPARQTWGAHCLCSAGWPAEPHLPAPAGLAQCCTCWDLDWGRTSSGIAPPSELLCCSPPGDSRSGLQNAGLPASRGKAITGPSPVATARKVNMHSLDWTVSLLLRTCMALRNSCRVEFQYPTRAIPSQPPCPTRRVLLTAIYR